MLRDAARKLGDVNPWQARTGFHGVKVSLSVALGVIGFIGVMGYVPSALLGCSTVTLSISGVIATCAGGTANFVGWYRGWDGKKFTNPDALANGFFDVCLIIYNVATAVLAALVITGTLSASTACGFIIAPIVIRAALLDCLINTCGNAYLVIPRWTLDPEAPGSPARVVWSVTNRFSPNSSSHDPYAAQQLNSEGVGDGLEAFPARSIPLIPLPAGLCQDGSPRVKS